MEQLHLPMLIVSVLLAVLIAGLYILGIFLRSRAQIAVSYITLLFNAMYIIALLLLGVELEIATLCIMCSVFLYTVCYYIRYELRRRQGLRTGDTPEPEGADSIGDGEVQV